MKTKTYTVEEAGFILGQHYDVGDPVSLNVKQARPFEREGVVKSGGKRTASTAGKTKTGADAS